MFLYHCDLLIMNDNEYIKYIIDNIIRGLYPENDDFTDSNLIGEM